MAASMIVESIMTSGYHVFEPLNHFIDLLEQRSVFPTEGGQGNFTQILTDVIPLRAAAFFNNHLLSKALSIQTGVFRKGKTYAVGRH